MLPAPVRSCALGGMPPLLADVAERQFSSLTKLSLAQSIFLVELLLTEAPQRPGCGWRSRCCGSSAG